MDISSLIQYNPNIAIEHTTKKYFGKYLYKLVVYAPAGRLIDAKESIADAIIHRRHVAKHINQSGWWGRRHNKDLENVDSEFLSVLRTIRTDRTLGIKMRVEEPNIQLYFETEADLTHLVDTYFNTKQQQYITSIAKPANDTAAEILNSGAIIRKTDNGYTHKVILRDGRYKVDIKETVLNYLYNLNIEIAGVPDSCRVMFSKPTSYIWNCYFFTNDPSVTTFLNLISPGIVSNIHELVIVTNK